MHSTVKRRVIFHVLKGREFTYIICNLFSHEIFFILHLLIPLFISVWAQVLNEHHFDSVAQYVPTLPTSGSCVSWTYSIHYGFSCIYFFSTFLFIGTTGSPKLLLSFSCPMSKISHFFKVLYFLFLKKSFRNQTLDVRYALWCYWGVLTSRSSQLTDKRINTCGLTHAYAHKCFYM